MDDAAVTFDRKDDGDANTDGDDDDTDEGSHSSGAGGSGSDSDDTFTLNYGNLPAASLVVDPATLAAKHSAGGNIDSVVKTLGTCCPLVGVRVCPAAMTLLNMQARRPGPCLCGRTWHTANALTKQAVQRLEVTACHLPASSHPGWQLHPTTRLGTPLQRTQMCPTTLATAGNGGQSTLPRAMKSTSQRCRCVHVMGCMLRWDRSWRPVPQPHRACVCLLYLPTRRLHPPRPRQHASHSPPATACTRCCDHSPAASHPHLRRQHNSSSHRSSVWSTFDASTRRPMQLAAWKTCGRRQPRLAPSHAGAR